MKNSLLTNEQLPQFKQIQVKDIEPAIDYLLQRNREQIQAVLKDNNSFSWQNLMQTIDNLDDELNRAWSPVSHMNSVVNSDELREAYQACIGKLSEYGTEISQNVDLYQAIQSLKDSKEYQALSVAQKKIIDNDLRDFRLSGVSLEADKKEQYKFARQRLTELCNKFEENILDATNAWHKQIGDEKQLAGLPDHAIATAKETAQRKKLDGFVLSLEFPCYFAVVTYGDNRELREELYKAFVTRASDQGPNAGDFDNSEIMDEIVSLRHHLANLVGFKNFAEYSLAKKMASEPKQVTQFLTELVEQSRPQAKQEFKELSAFAKQEHGIEKLEPWDIAYYSEKLRQHRYAISQEELRPYFPEDKALSGMFEIVHRLYGLTIKECQDIQTWHKDVRFFELRDEQDEVCGQLYVDLYARSKKRGGAWMDECVVRRRLDDGRIQVPVAYLTCNFAPPSAGTPALFSHDEVVTLFHEFGHCLHHLLTRVDYAGVSGINGVPWDAVELPSQFFENWCWHEEALALCAEHYKTGEALPHELFEKLLKAKNFQSAMQMLRQLEFALFDFRMHHEYNPDKGTRIQDILNEVRSQVSVVPVPDFNRFQHGFSHIFAGGYAAGYYSYKWAEVLSSDAFELFEENGIFDQATGRKFLQTVLQQGGSREPLDLFVEFRGREPKIDALLRHSGINVS